MPRPTHPRPSQERPVYTLRLGIAERALIEAAAAQRSEYLAEYLRDRALEAARRDLASDRPGE